MVEDSAVRLSPSSPHTRGYFRRWYLPGYLGTLFPAHAGVFPSPGSAMCRAVTLPRTRGGISKSDVMAARAGISSPHTRGYFRLGHWAGYHRHLFPAHAGVFPVG